MKEASSLHFLTRVLYTQGSHYDSPAGFYGARFLDIPHKVINLMLLDGGIAKTIGVFTSR